VRDLSVLRALIQIESLALMFFALDIRVTSAARRLPDGCDRAVL